MLLYRTGLCAAGCALHPDRRSGAASGLEAAIEYSLELWPRDHSAALARYRRHRIRRRRSQGKVRRRRDRRDVAGGGFPFPERVGAPGERRRQIGYEF